MRLRFGTVYGLNGPEFHNVRMQDQFDALLYLGPPSSMTFAELSRSRCTDESYMKMRLARMALRPLGPIRDQWPEFVLRSPVTLVPAGGEPVTNGGGERLG